MMNKTMDLIEVIKHHINTEPLGNLCILKKFKDHIKSYLDFEEEEVKRISMTYYIDYEDIRQRVIKTASETTMSIEESLSYETNKMLNEFNRKEINI